VRYVDHKKFPALFEPVAGRQLPGTALQNKPGRAQILTEKNLAGYRKNPGGLPLFSTVDGQAQQAETADYGPAIQAHRETVARIREALNERRVAAGRRPLVWDAVSPANGPTGRSHRAGAAVAKRHFNVEIIWVDFKAWLAVAWSNRWP